MIFHEIKVHYDRQTGEDNPGKVKEVYLIDGAVSFSDAEKCLIEEIKPFVFGDCEVHNCKRSQFFDIFPNEGGAYWYKARVEMITIDNDKETRKSVLMLIQANTLSDAIYALGQNLGSYDHEIISVAKSPIMDVLHATH
ncbi:MAG: DUF4494 family protein [Paludibacteraceae bacterium]|jgi:hypothetical protein|nr:DUF4494 family protein [Paludibacteraceae bacterium]MEE0952081.1 DUF4494 family protein [Paludibacteraceae bacterium]MEE1069229.1 DUF4494 family protein [Paludibacteraceae bacterium]MEE1254425.1 DUF4494 family protein [Paludibacteraceae bacterium]